MEIRTSTIAVVAASCITVGAAGAYLASRPSPTSQPGAVPADAAGVEQSEAVIADDPAVQPAEAAPAPATAAAPARVAASRSLAAPTTSRTPRPAPAPVSKPLPSSPASPAPQQARAALPGPQHAPAPSIPAARPDPRETSAPLEPTEPIEPTVAATGPRLVDLEIATDSVLGLQIETPVTSEKARVEDEVLARVTRDVRVGDRVAIPAGSQARGEVTMVERGGKVKDRARLGIRFTSVVLADGTRVPLETDTIYREGDSPSTESTAKIGGGAIGGAILGGIFGGAKGAAIGAATGAGAGTAMVVAGGRNAATLPAGTPVTVRVIKPARVTVEE
jgi:hypothetical protein